MGSLFPAISTIIASSTADAASLGGYIIAPTLVLAFSVTVVVVASVFVRKWILGGVKRAAGVRGKGRGRRRK